MDKEKGRETFGSLIGERGEEGEDGTAEVEGGEGGPADTSFDEFSGLFDDRLSNQVRRDVNTTTITTIASGDATDGEDPGDVSAASSDRPLASQRPPPPRATSKKATTASSSVMKTKTKARATLSVKRRGGDYDDDDDDDAEEDVVEEGVDLEAEGAEKLPSVFKAMIEEDTDLWLRVLRYEVRVREEIEKGHLDLSFHHNPSPPPLFSCGHYSRPYVEIITPNPS